MTDLADKLEALAPNVLYAERLRTSGYTSTAELVDMLPTLIRALRERDQAVDALREADAVFVERHGGINGGMPRLPAIDLGWRIIRATLASIEGAGDE